MNKKLFIERADGLEYIEAPSDPNPRYLFYDLPTQQNYNSVLYSLEPKPKLAIVEHTEPRTMPSQLGWIWPKDPRPGNPQHWPRRWRLFDVLTNKGPDIYVGRINQSKSKSKSKSASTPRSSGPTREEWSRWGDNPNDPDADFTPIPWVGRPAGERYDFRTRKYHVPDHGTWSAVEYCNGSRTHKGKWLGKKEVHCVPLRYRDRNGAEYPAEFWHDSLYGKHGD